MNNGTCVTLRDPVGARGDGSGAGRADGCVRAGPSASRPRDMRFLLSLDKGAGNLVAINLMKTSVET